jgi:hypothetical protein
LTVTLTGLVNRPLVDMRAWDPCETARNTLERLDLLRASHTDENLMIEVEDLHPDTEVNRLDALSVHLTCQT